MIIGKFNCLKYLFVLIPFLLIQKLPGQEVSEWQQKPALSLTGFIDTYYVYDFNQPESDIRQPFLYNHNRHNEFNLNLGLIQFNIEHPKYRASLAMQSGTYVNDNYAAEPGFLKNVYNANIGVALNSKNTLWFDAGIFGSSHIGFESALSIEDLTLTRSILAENSPYFISGAKLSYSPTPDWDLAALVINGWQRIKRLDGNSMLSFGTQVNYHPTERLTLNWSTFIGTDDPDSTRRMRYFNNFYGLFHINERIALITGFDIGFQQREKNSSRYDLWMSPVIIAQYAISAQWHTALRAEYYQDETGIMIPTGTKNGFKTTGFSLNVDYLPIPLLACRLEARLLHSKDKIFKKGDSFTNQNFILAASIALKFNREI